MTNAEFNENLEAIAMITIVLMIRCDGDKSKIDETLWDKLYRLAKDLEDYI